MSRTEHHIGTLKEIDLKGRTIEDLAKELSGKDFYPGYYDGWLDFFRDEFSKTHHYHKDTGKVYSMEDRELEENAEIIRADRKSENIIEYEVKFYNGGAGLDECIDEALDKLKKEEDGKSI